MSEQKLPKKVFGRGRGKPNRTSEGPWVRSKKLDDDTQDIRPPKEGEEFILSDSSFPPLPGAANQDGQFDDPVDSAGTSSNSNGEVDNGEKEDSKTLREKTSEIAQGVIPKDIRRDVQSPENQNEGILSTVNTNMTRNHSFQDVQSPENQNEGILPTVNTNMSRNHSVQDVQSPENQNEGILPTVNTNMSRNHSVQVDVENSSLSPYAPEFVPKLQNMNPEAQDFVPTATNGSIDEANNNKGTIQSSVSNINVNDTTAVLADLEETVVFCHSKLIETPASYDELIGVVTPHFIKYMENPEVPIAIIQMLYNYAIQDARFSYFAVKILIHLIKITATENKTQLRDTLLRHTQEEVKRVSLTDPNINCTNDVQPFLTFLSELYIQLEVGGRHLAPIGCFLVETLKKLLSIAHIPIKERLKLTVSMIKLAGLPLDEHDPSLLDSLFSELDMILNQERFKLDNPTVQFVNDLRLLRTLHWGRVEPDVGEYFTESDEDVPRNGNHTFSQSDTHEHTSDSNTEFDNSGVFYGPDGRPIDLEEQLFLEVETNAMNQLQMGEQGEQSPTSVEGFDEAYEEAYEEFLKTVPGYSAKQ